jgi:hypothetical protein
MVLDMNLNKKYYVMNWEHDPDEEKHTITILKGGKPSSIPVDKITYIVTEEIYWRKANQIHRWFVDNVQDGIDNCGDYYVSREKLEQLLDTVNKVLKASELQIDMVKNGATLSPETGYHLVPNWEVGNAIKDPSIAQEMLPTTSGFFFGGTDYDQFYYNDLEYTRKELERILSSGDDGDFYYNSSW